MKFRLTCLIVALAACTGSTGPRAHVGTYVLVSVDDELLPATTAFDGGYRYVAVSANTILRYDMSFTKNALEEKRNSDDELIETIPSVYNGNYEIVGSRITFNLPANASEPAHSVEGEIANGVLVQTSVDRTWRFVRQP